MSLSVCLSASGQCTTLGYLDDDVASYCYERVFLSVCLISVQLIIIGYLDDDVAIYCDEPVCLSVCPSQSSSWLWAS